MSGILEPGTLWRRTMAQTARALRLGVLQPLPTESLFVEQDGLRFVVRLLPELARQHQALQKPDEHFDPFLPYDPDLFVAELSDTHLALLNKFSVVDHHLLIVTRAFEEQESPLTLVDFEALALCLAEVDGLAFYNAGPVAGASQRHKHLQLVPLPLAAEGPAIPLEPAFATARFQEGRLGRVPLFSFAHAFAYLEVFSPAILSATYGFLRRGLGLQERAPYNLLATRQWMMLVPRQSEKVEGISVNALGFAGALLVRDEQQLQAVTTLGPLEVLRRVGVPT